MIERYVTQVKYDTLLVNGMIKSNVIYHIVEESKTSRDD